MNFEEPRTGRASPPRIVAAETPALASIIPLAIGVIVLAGLYFARDILIPIVLAVLLSFVLTPVVHFLRKIRIPRVAAAVISVIAAVGFLLSLTAVIGSQIADLTSELPRYQTTIREKAVNFHETIVGPASDILKRFGRELREATPPEARKPGPPAAAPMEAPLPAPPPPPGATASEQSEPPPPMRVEVQEPELTPLQLARNLLLPIAKPLATAGIVFIVLLFILLQQEDLRDRMIRLFGSRDLHRTTIAMDEAGSRLSRFFLVQLALNSGFGAFIGVGLWLIGVPNPVLWAVFTALMRFVPYVGSWIAAVLPVFLAAAVEPGWGLALWTIALFAVTEPLMGHVVEPMVYGHSTGLSPFAVLVATIFWTWLWGPIGLLLATPMTLCLVVLGRHVESLEFLDVLLGDRPALTPIENFYQRMLAGDNEEVMESAELYLRERPLVSYYDEVAVGGLHLTARDAARGVLSERRLESIRRNMKDLIEDLEDHEDTVSAPPAAPVEDPEQPPPLPPGPEPIESEKLPPAWRGEAPILCISGRGVLDESAAGMLAQLLTRQGLGARMVPHGDGTRRTAAAFDLDGVAMICIAYLELSGRPAHLRLLVRRLKQRRPDIPILVGLALPNEDTAGMERLKETIGADFVVSSLREAVATCRLVAESAIPEEEREASLGSDEAGAAERKDVEPAAQR